MKTEIEEPGPSIDRWYIAGRWLEYEGELRAALVRVLLVAAFYAAQLAHYLVFSDRTTSEQLFHRQATYIAGAWLFVSLAVLVALTRHWFPKWLKFVTTASDLFLLTTIAALGSGPESPLVVVYWVIIGMAGLRGNLPLIWFATIGAMISYLILVAKRDTVWFDAEHTTPVIKQLVIHIAIAAEGAIVGQLVRMMRQVMEETFAPVQKDT